MSTPNKICNDGTSKSNNADGVCEINDKLENMKTTGAEDNVSIVCANCGKGEDGTHSLKACTACKMVKYCNRECQIAHRPQHKKACKKRAAELHDDALFKQPPLPFEDCPICFLRMPSMGRGSKYQTCCGKRICSGCSYKNSKIDIKKQLCAFCRIPTPETLEVAVERLKKRVEAGEAPAMYSLGCEYRDGTNGVPQNWAKALELWHQAAELGFAAAYSSIGIFYETGRCVEVDREKARHFWELAAMGGIVGARHILGCKEVQAGNVDIGIKHYIIAVEGGYSDSLKEIKVLYKNGKATKEDYTKALRAHQSYLDEIRSAQRDEAAAFKDDYKYY